ncbi:MAG: TRAP transporter small permease [Candidatus Dormibacteraceae bacterium]
MIERVVRGASAGVAALAIAVLMVLVTANVVARSLGSSALAGATNFAGYLLLLGAIGAAASSMGSGAFIRMDTIDRWLGRRALKATEVLNLALTTVLMAYLAYAAFEKALRSFVQGGMSSGLWALPEFLPQSLEAILLALAAVYAVLLGIRLFRSKPKDSADG